MTKLKHPNIKGLFKEVPNEAVAEWLAAGWLNPSAKKPVKAETNSPETAENTENKES